MSCIQLVNRKKKLINVIHTVKVGAKFKIVECAHTDWDVDDIICLILNRNEKFIVNLTKNFGLSFTALPTQVDHAIVAPLGKDDEIQLVSCP